MTEGVGADGGAAREGASSLAADGAAREGAPSLAASGAASGAALAAALLAFDAVRNAVGAQDVLEIDGALVRAALILSAAVVIGAALLGAVGLALLGRVAGPRAGLLRRLVVWVSVGLVVVGLGVTWRRSAPLRAEEPRPAPVSRPAAPTDAPDVVVIVIDTLRADSLEGPDGESLVPHLARLAGEATTFDAATSVSSWTRPATAGLLTGRYPSHLDAHTLALPESAETLAEVFRGAGYRTAAFSDNYNVSPSWGFDQGFDVFEVANHYLVLRGFLPLRFLPRMWVESVRRQLRLVYMGAEFVNGGALAYLDAETPADAPLFLYLHYMDPHYPYYVYDEDPHNVSNRADPDSYLSYEALLAPMVPKPYVQQLDVPQAQIDAMRTRYLGGIQYADDAVGRVLERLRARERWDDTVVVVTGDHGEEFLEHGLWGHGHALYEEQVHVPLWIKPRAGEGDELWRAARHETPVGTLQVAATVAELAGVAPPEGAVPGLAGWLRGEPGEALAHSEVTRRGVVARTARQGPHKIHRIERDGAVHYEFYDLAADPSEQDDLFERRAATPEVQALLREVDALDALLAQGAAPRSDESRSITDEQRDRLRALGYVE